MARTTRTDLDSDPLDQPLPSLPPLRPRRSRSWLVALVLLGMIVWFLPTFLAVTPLCDRLLEWSLEDLDGRVTVEGLSLGWLSPVVARNIELHDAEGRVIGSVPLAATEKTLLGLAWSYTEPGVVRLEKPQLELVLSEQSSNLEDVVRRLLAKPASPHARSVGLTLDVVAAQVSIRDAVTDGRWRLDAVDARIVVPPVAHQPLEVEATGTLVQEPEPGSLELKLHAHAAAPDGMPRDHAGRVALQLKHFPLELAQALVRRIEPATRMAGRLSAEVQADWTTGKTGLPGNAQLALNADLHVEGLWFASPWISGDTMQLAEVRIPCRAALNGSRLAIEELSLVTDVGRITCQATVDEAPRFYSGGVAAWSRLAQYVVGKVEGEVDLARLSRTLPRTLRVRDDVRITGGAVKLACDVKPQGETPVWLARVDTTPLTAVHQGRTITWNEPLRIDAEVRQLPQGFEVDRLVCESSFLRVEGQGSPNQFQVVSSFDLRRLEEEASRFLDLGGLRLAGNGSAVVELVRQPDERFAATAQAQLNAFELSRPGTLPWQEQQLTVTASAEGRTQGTAIADVSRAGLTLISGGDQLTLDLVQPVASPGWNSTFPVEVAAQGRMATWLPRLAPWVALPAGLNLEGIVQLGASGRAGLREVELTQAAVDVQQFRCWGQGLYLDEPRVRLGARGRWTAEPLRIEVPEAALEATAGSARLSQGVVAWRADGALEARGRVVADGDLARVAAWLQDPAVPPKLRLAGRVQAQADLDQSGDTIGARADATLTNLYFAAAGGQAWQEPQVRLQADGRYAPRDDRAELSRFDLSSQVLTLRAAGSLARLGTTRDVDLRGKIDYDLARLQPLVQAYLGPSVQVIGRESRDFRLTGPLMAPVRGPAGLAHVPSLAQLTGDGSLGWQGLYAYGLQAGPGALQAQLARGVLRTSPIEFAVNEGRFRLVPQLRLDPLPRELTLEPGTVLDRVRITPAMCNEALMYAAPILAGVTTAEGRVSVGVQSSRIPLDQPARMDTAGQLVIHEVEVGPGPLVQALAVVLNRVEPARLKRESVVPFRVVEGRVYHEGLELAFPDLVVRTYGSVGFDQTLALMAEMPIPPKWLGNNTVGQALQGQTIRLPIGGTLAAPRIDERALQMAMGQVVQGTADTLIRGELNRQLDRLLGPMQPTAPAPGAPAGAPPAAGSVPPPATTPSLSIPGLPGGIPLPTLGPRTP